ncbi:NAD(P)-dependent dehydrogenase (short-subunit alcohol dehydrogenase family) [Amphiplicatus metriothermophilus]|nr:NAD(P)-dependent dehydrogenase (short-subunit alcohol dehydrogenase family) [Amphiplicatus metriothermophilus]
MTGAGSGIGRALALALARRGAVLALSDVNPETLAETVAMVGGPSQKAFSEKLDVADAAAVEAYAAGLRARLGPADYVFNVAGLSRIGRFRHTPLASFEKVIEVNFWGVVRMSKAFLPQLLENARRAREHRQHIRRHRRAGTGALLRVEIRRARLQRSAHVRARRGRRARDLRHAGRSRHEYRARGGGRLAAAGRALS